ncbi:MAG: hypothetical protein M0Q94_09020 [Candidatus Cloacimonetes bacterium]|nr:hypothetical protein [Candidatus Cloacimonadota bacterium]
MIDEIGDVVNHHPYLAFLLISSGIEFLGKCIDTKNQEWDTNKNEQDEPPFDKAIKELFPEKYKIFLEKYNLRDQLRNGMSHMYTPKAKIGLTQIKHDHDGKIKYKDNPVEEDNKLTIVIEYFYIDFVNACKTVIEKDFDVDKMNKPLLSIPN